MHAKFLSMVPLLLGASRETTLFGRMAERSGVEHRYSVFAPHRDDGRIDSGDVYRVGRFPDTGERMRLFEAHALPVALAAIDALGREAARGATHLVVSCCTGFTAPGIDFLIADALGMDPGVERSMIGFMGCSAALNTLKAARHIVRSDPAARVLVVNLELCTLHFRETRDIEEMLSFLIFADGCAASLVTAAPAGVELREFRSLAVPDSTGHLTWRIGEAGFVMHLAGALPATVGRALQEGLHRLLGDVPARDIALWAVHPGGRSVLDAVARGCGAPVDLSASREVLRRYGNMSSPTVMFVLKRLMDDPDASGEGCMLAFGPGVTVEAGRFRKVA